MLSKSAFPDGGIAARVEASNHMNRIIEWTEIQAIWKSPQASATDIRQHQWELEWVSEYAFHLPVKFSSEPRT